MIKIRCTREMLHERKIICGIINKRDNCVNSSSRPDICHRGYAYTVLQTVQRHGVYSAV